MISLGSHVSANVHVGDASPCRMYMWVMMLQADPQGRMSTKMGPATHHSHIQHNQNHQSLHVSDMIPHHHRQRVSSPTRDFDGHSKEKIE